MGRSFIDYVMSEDQPDFCRQVTDRISVPLCQMSIRSDQSGSGENDQKVEQWSKEIAIAYGHSSVSGVEDQRKLFL